MASGHINRANRPNTWLHRPACRREEKPCQLGAVHTWHKADMPVASVDVRFWVKRTWDAARSRSSPSFLTFSDIGGAERIRAADPAIKA